jgi:enediyne biosynthesis protein E4
VHFGLGDATTIDQIEIRWPSGIRQILKEVKPDQVLTVTESAS